MKYFDVTFIDKTTIRYSSITKGQLILTLTALGLQWSYIEECSNESERAYEESEDGPEGLK